MPKRNAYTPPTLKSFPAAKGPADVPIGDLHNIAKAALDAAAHDHRLLTGFGWVACSFPGVDGRTVMEAVLRAWDVTPAADKLSLLTEVIIDAESPALAELAIMSLPGWPGAVRRKDVPHG